MGRWRVIEFNDIGKDGIVIATVDPEKIKDIQIVRTVVGGTTAYQA